MKLFQRVIGRNNFRMVQLHRLSSWSIDVMAKNISASSNKSISDANNGVNSQHRIANRNVQAAGANEGIVKSSDDIRREVQTNISNYHLRRNASAVLSQIAIAR